MTNRLTPDDYATMGAEELRPLVEKKQAAYVEAEARAQLLGFTLRKSEDEVRRLEQEVERLKRLLAWREREGKLVGDARFRAEALNVLLFEKLAYLSGIEKKPADIKKVMALFCRLLEQVGGVTSKELGEESLKTLFEAAEKRVFGTGKKPAPKKAADLIERSLKKKNKKE